MLDSLAAILGAKGLLVEPADMAGYVEDWRGRYRGPALCVALPSSTKQVSDVVRLCTENRVSIIPQGGNTSLCGGAVPDAAGPQPVIMGLQRMRQIRSIDPVNNSISVDAGCTLAAIQEEAIRHDRLYPVSLGAEGSCQVGGTIATNAGGTGVLRYGNTRENVFGLEVVLPDGQVWSGMNALRKNNTGYDLKHLFIGSEGTLGIVTGAVLKLHPLPTARSVAWLSVTDPQAALDLLGLFRSTSETSLSAFEVMNERQVELVVEFVLNRRAPVSGSPWHILVELSDTTDQGSLDAKMEAVLATAFEAGLVQDGVVGASKAQCHEMWEFRHSVSEANKKGGVGLTSDTAVPVSAVPAFLAAAEAAVHSIVPDLPIVVVGHMGDGNMHFIPFFPHQHWDSLPDSSAMTVAIRQAVNDAAAAFGGTFSAEHGVGRTLTGAMTRYKPTIELSLMQIIKHSLDPAGLFNPGRLLPASI